MKVCVSLFDSWELAKQSAKTWKISNLLPVLPSFKSDIHIYRTTKKIRDTISTR